MGALSLVWLATAASIATRRVRRAGLSCEARATEFFHGAGAHARHALRHLKPFEVRSQPSKLKRAATYFFCAVWMAVMSVCVLACWSLLHDPDTSLPFKITMAVTLVFCPLVPLASVAYLYLLAFDPPDFRADSRGLRGCHGLWFRTVRWEQVETMEIIATHNLFGELARLQPRFKDARGKTILLLNLSLGCTPEARDSIVSFLRAACSEPAASELEP